MSAGILAIHTPNRTPAPDEALIRTSLPAVMGVTQHPPIGRNRSIAAGRVQDCHGRLAMNMLPSGPAAHHCMGAGV